ncbi:hypothetical protein [Citrobacter amalonaticus]|uniref:hypothetical protein n=1 Tax=Citrobacter amalonaticus TaxID=35703 RepID=UPI00215629AA|nr:hypothetical protein [Citrobacter amalonaticus]
MVTTITAITECLKYFFSSLYRQKFVKTLRLDACGERKRQPLVRYEQPVLADFSNPSRSENQTECFRAGPLQPGEITVNPLSGWSVSL